MARIGRRGASLALFALLGACATEIGDTCEEHDDCSDVRGGYCSLVGVCTRDCTETPCPAGSTCAIVGNTESNDERMICLRSCQAGEDCNDNEVCKQEPSPDGDDVSKVCVVAQPLEAL